MHLDMTTRPDPHFMNIIHRKTHSIINHVGGGQLVVSQDMALFVEVEDHSRRSAAATTATTVQASPDVRLDEDGEVFFT